MPTVLFLKDLSWMVDFGRMGRLCPCEDSCREERSVRSSYTRLQRIILRCIAFAVRRGRLNAGCMTALQWAPS